MHPAATPTALAYLGTIRVSGAGARDFLQGQLSADLRTLDPRRLLLASCNSPQGRVQSVLWMLERSEGIALLLPASMIEATVVRLRKYVLRSRVKIEAGGLAVATLDRSALPDAVALTAIASRVEHVPHGGHPSHQQSAAHHEHDGASYVSLPGHELVLQITTGPVEPAGAGTQMAWRLDDIRAGLPQVHPQTHEAFVAQMLNLDLLGGISFEKGCYTGQEIIARTHYRGTVKRRMFRYTAPCPPPPPGTRIIAGAQHAGDVVDAAPAGAGCELLAVVSVAQAQAALQLSDLPGVALEPAPLPYSVG